MKRKKVLNLRPNLELHNMKRTFISIGETQHVAGFYRLVRMQGNVKAINLRGSGSFPGVGESRRGRGLFLGRAM